MSNRGHYLKTCSRPSRPAAVVGVAVETDARDLGASLSADCERSFRAVHVNASKRSHGRWSYPVNRSFPTREQFWEWLCEWGIPDRRTYVFATVASDALTLLGFWSRCDQLGARWERGNPADGGRDVRGGTDARICVRRMVLRGKPDICDYSECGRRFVWLSLSQYLPADLAVLARDTGHRWTREELRVAAEATGMVGAEEEARIIGGAFRRLSDWWGVIGKGPWRETASGLAMSFYRSRLAPRSVCTHNCERTRKLESHARHGARMSVWFYGEVRPGGADGPPIPGVSGRGRSNVHPGPVVQVDVRSMYPYLMREHVYPVRRIRYYDKPTVEFIESGMGSLCVIARCEVNTRRAEYPHRAAGRVFYPVGRFLTTLCGPELARAIRDGEVVRIVSAAVYEPGRPFASAARDLIELRGEARSRTDCTLEALVKLISNSLTGRLAQRRSRWVPSPATTSEGRWSEWTARTLDTGEVTRFRDRAGLVERLHREDHGTGTMTAQYAFLTSYGRYHMRLIRESLPVCSVLHQHTDGLWITADACASLFASGRLRSAVSPGGLRVVAVSSTCKMLGPAHYITDLGWQLGGFHRPLAHSIHRIEDTCTINPIRTTPPGPPETVREVRRVTGLAIDREPGWVDRYGWHHPITLPDTRYMSWRDAPADES